VLAASLLSSTNTFASPVKYNITNANNDNVHATKRQREKIENTRAPISPLVTEQNANIQIKKHIQPQTKTSVA
jgi:hypothetical protein